MGWENIMLLYKKLKTALVESDVATIYKHELCNWFGGNIEIVSPHRTDGVLKNEDLDLNILLEFKYNKNFLKRTDTIKVIMQCLYYLKSFQNAGQYPPKIIFVGDINELFYIHYNRLKKYLDKNIDWTVAPSKAMEANQDLFKEMYEDKEISPYVYEVNSKLNVKEIIKGIINTASCEYPKIKIVVGNIDNLFNFFITKVLRKKKKYTVNEQVSIFLNMIINPKENYLHPKMESVLVTKAHGNIIINRHTLDSLFHHFEEDYSPKEKEDMTSVCDRLIKDETRRKQGEFYTPTIWVNEAHKMIEEQFGIDWKEKYVVWDPACGTGNLTRDYNFRELYCSTLNKSDTDIIEQSGYNPEAVKFQFDFLNDPDDKLPKSLKSALKAGKKILVLMNPPYGTAKSGGAKKDNNKI